MSGRDSQVKSKVMERIAFGLVVIFALGMSYAVYMTQQTVENINQNYHSSTEVYSPENQPESKK